ncbi:DMT family transporter [bacterium]|nr:DMT family transporter [bacterium]
MWFLFLLISIFLSSATSIVQKLALRDKRIDSTAFAIFYQVLTGLLLLGYAVYSGMSFNGFSAKMPSLLLAISLYSIGDVLAFKVIQKMEMSDFTIVYQINALFAVIFSSIFLGESLNFVQGLGFLFIFLGILVTLYEHKIVIHKYHLLTCLTAAILALAFINDASIVKTLDVPTYLAFIFIMPGLVTLLFYPKGLKNLPVLLDKKHIIYLILASVFVAFGAVLFFISYRIVSNAAQISSLGKLSTIIIVLFGIFFLGEKNRKVQKIIGSIVALVGVFLLI